MKTKMETFFGKMEADLERVERAFRKSHKGKMVEVVK